MKYIFFFVFALYVIPSFTFSQSTVPSWTHTPSPQSPNIHRFPHLAGVPGGVYAVGNYETASDMLHLRFVNDQGTFQWEHTFSNPIGQEWRDMKTDPAGNLYLLLHGTLSGSPSSARCLVLYKYDITGNQVYATQYNFIDSTFSNEGTTGNSLAVDQQGNAYVLGLHSHGNCQDYDLRTVVMKFSPGGQHLWTYALPFNTGMVGNIALSNSGKVYVSYRQVTGPVVDYKITRHDSSTGALTGTYLFVPPGAGYALEPATIHTGPQGDMMAMIPMADYNKRIAVVRLDQAMSESWRFVTGFPAEDITANDFIVDAAGNSYVSFIRFNGSVPYSNLISADAAGAFRWLRDYALTGSSVPKDLELAPNGEIYLLELIDTVPNVTFLSAQARRIDSNGTLTWKSDPLNFSGTTAPTSNIAIDPNGGLYFSCDPLGANYIVYFDGPAPNALSTPFDYKFTFYPNPFSERIHVNGKPVSGAAFRLLDMQGRILRSGTLSVPGSIEAGELPSGCYLLNVNTPDGFTASRVLIKE